MKRRAGRLRRELAAFMAIERVDITPRTEVYHPGDVLNVSLRFARPFAGQCEAGLVPKDADSSDDFNRSVFARSGADLYEGQVHVRSDHVGPCILTARLSAPDGKTQTVAIGDRIIHVRPIRP